MAFELQYIENAQLEFGTEFGLNAQPTRLSQQSLTAKEILVESLSAISAILGTVTVGTGITLDGDNNRIVMNDGSDDRLLIGDDGT